MTWPSLFIDLWPLFYNFFVLSLFFSKAQLEKDETQTKGDKKENWDGLVYDQGSLNQQTFDSNIVYKI